MSDTKLSVRDSLAIDCIKAFAILSVIAAHTVVLDASTTFTDIVTSIWTIFSRVGVVAFLIVGGFLYSRKDRDGKSYWKKKFLRIILPWFICSAITYAIGIIGGNELSVLGYIKWIFGYGTWYYYIVIYVFFLLIFKWFYKSTSVLCVLVGIQVLTLMLNTFGVNITLGVDYLNPLFWIGYFALGILIRRYRLDKKISRNNVVLIISIVLSIGVTTVMHIYGIYTYFSLITMVNCISVSLILYRVAYFIAKTKIATVTRYIGVSTYCIYLLHMQIVQTAIGLIPASGVTYLFAPFIGLAIMMVIIFIANMVCKKLPFGDKLKMCFGL